MAEKKETLEKAVPGNGEKGETAVINEKPETRFTKEQLLSSGRFRERRDIADALLKTGELYTVKTVEQMIEKYMKGKVE